MSSEEQEFKCIIEEEGKPMCRVKSGMIEAGMKNIVCILYWIPVAVNGKDFKWVANSARSQNNTYISKTNACLCSACVVMLIK